MAREIYRTKMGAKIRQYRKALHLTQEEVAAKLNIKRNTFARYETDTEPPTYMLTAIGNFFGITTDELLGNNKNYSPQIIDVEKTLIKFAAENGYNYNFTKEELNTILKIGSLTPEKKEQLFKYIESVIEDEDLL